MLFPEFQDFSLALSLRTGLPIDKLEGGIALLKTLSELSVLLNNDFVLFGGTALNFFYFGNSQRLSFDADIKTKNFEKTAAKLKEKYSLDFRTKKFYVFRTEHGVKIDLATDYWPEKPELLSPKSLFHLHDYPIYNFQIPVYSFETLFAQKVLALATRGTARDLYDAWVAMSLEYDQELFLKKLIKQGKKYKIDPRVIITPSHHVDLDMEKIDSLLPNLDGKQMYQEVQDFMRMLFFD